MFFRAFVTRIAAVKCPGMRLAKTLIIALSLACGSALAQGPAPAAFTTHQLAPNLYWVEGGGGNSGVIVGNNGVIAIDAKTTAAGGKALLDESHDPKVV